MGLIRLAVLGAAGYAGYRYFQGKKHESHAAFASGQPHAARTDSFTPVRDAGPEAMRDTPQKWSRTDQATDESFPASDAPGNY